MKCLGFIWCCTIKYGVSYGFCINRSVEKMLYATHIPFYVNVSEYIRESVRSFVFFTADYLKWSYGHF